MNVVILKCHMKERYYDEGKPVVCLLGILKVELSVWFLPFISLVMVNFVNTNK